MDPLKTHAMAEEIECITWPSLVKRQKCGGNNAKMGCLPKIWIFPSFLTIFSPRMMAVDGQTA
jgi:hypothetical protein